MLGNTHCAIGKHVLELENFGLNQCEKKAFLSGLVYADIGRLKLDNIIGVKSDSYEFLNKMSNNIKNNVDKWFVLGSFLHVFQDIKTKKILSNIFSTNNLNYFSYIKYCGFLEHFFLFKNQEYIFDEKLKVLNVNYILNNIQLLEFPNFFNRLVEKLFLYGKKVYFKEFYSKFNKMYLMLPVALVKNTYKDFNLTVCNEELMIQAVNVLIASVMLCNFFGYAEKKISRIKSRIELEMDKICRKSVKFVKRKLLLLNNSL